MVNVIDYEAGEGHAEDGGYVDGGAVNLGFGGAPVVIQESRIAGTVLRNNTSPVRTAVRANALKTIFSRARTAIMTTVRMKTSLARTILTALRLNISESILHFTDTIRTTVLQDFVIIYTEELVGRERSGTLHLLAESSTERATAHIPELRHLDLKRIRLQGSAQRAIELSLARCRLQNQ